MKTDACDSLHKTLQSLCGSISGVAANTLPPQTDLCDLVACFAGQSGTVLLLSGGDLDCARYHILGVMPWLTLRGGSGKVQVATQSRSQVLHADPFDVLQGCLRCCRLPRGSWESPMTAGLMGYLAYDLKDCLESLPRTSVDDAGLPPMLFFAPSAVVVQDRRQQVTRLLIVERDGDRRRTELIRRRFNAAVAKGRPNRERSPEACSGALRSNFDQAGYQAAVRRVIDYIAAGDVYQVNLSQRFEASWDGDGFALFQQLYQRNPAPFFAYIQAGDHQIVSTSPERFLLQNGDQVETRPIKGTRPRMSDPEEDAAMRRELAASAKDDAELSMIVDLLRNDIGKVCRAGSVRVVEHKRVEAYRNVYHLVSVVKGELDAGLDSVDLIKAAFPGGSITGCPKVRAMEIIDELETCRRHVYCGSIGYLSFHDTMDLSIAIRTATIVGGTLRYAVGGGIVYDSDPLAEYEETLHKGRTLMAACRQARQDDASAPCWFNGRLLPTVSAAVPVSDLGLQYGFGFFETLRADNGRVPLLADHIARFEKTWRHLMPSAPPDLTWDAVIGQVLEANNLQAGCAAVKILATRGSRDAPPWDHALLVTARRYRHRLTETLQPGITLGTYPFARQTPLADFKTLNYLYYFQAGRWAREQGFDEALIRNPDGSVSETNSANLLLINGRTVIRPQSPAVLPGVMTGAICRRLAAWGYRIAQAPVQPGDLLTADQVMAANALMGAVPVTALDAAARPPGDSLWQRLNDAIIPGWRPPAGVS